MQQWHTSYAVLVAYAQASSHARRDDLLRWQDEAQRKWHDAITKQGGDYNDILRMTEEMMSGIVKDITGGYKVQYEFI